jgi:hypothetical protein
VAIAPAVMPSLAKAHETLWVHRRLGRQGAMCGGRTTTGPAWDAGSAFSRMRGRSSIRTRRARPATSGHRWKGALHDKSHPEPRLSRGAAAGRERWRGPAPVGTGVVEGVCGHLVKDRLEQSGMHWTEGGAQGVLDLRAVRINGHWETYWQFHRHQQHQRLYGPSVPRRAG